MMRATSARIRSSSAGAPAAPRGFPRCRRRAGRRRAGTSAASQASTRVSRGWWSWTSPRMASRVTRPTLTPASRTRGCRGRCRRGRGRRARLCRSKRRMWGQGVELRGDEAGVPEAPEVVGLQGQDALVLGEDVERDALGHRPDQPQRDPRLHRHDRVQARLVVADGGEGGLDHDVVLVADAVLHLGDAGEMEAIEVGDHPARWGEDAAHEPFGAGLADVFTGHAPRRARHPAPDGAAVGVDAEQPTMQKGRMGHIQGVLGDGVDGPRGGEGAADDLVAGLVHEAEGPGVHVRGDARSAQTHTAPCCPARGRRCTGGRGCRPGPRGRGRGRSGRRWRSASRGSRRRAAHDDAPPRAARCGGGRSSSAGASAPR